MILRLVRPLWACAVAILAVTAFSRPVPPTSATLHRASGPTSETLAVLREIGVPTTATTDRRYRMITRQMPTPFPAGEGAKLTTDTQLEYLYTSRPILLVGWFKSYDRATSTVTVRVDPILTKFPHALDVRAKQLNIPVERVKNRELRPERAFKIGARTYFTDDTAPLEPESGKLRQTPPISIESIKPGDKITVSYRIQPGDTAARALNISKVDPSRSYFSADFDPTHGRMIPRRSVKVTSGSAEQRQFLNSRLPSRRGARP
ncbi:hypothetical protein LLG95_09465 [bacterium]|nr:hypothetical protein [bacterium]